MTWICLLKWKKCSPLALVEILFSLWLKKEGILKKTTSNKEKSFLYRGQLQLQLSQSLKYVIRKALPERDDFYSDQYKASLIVVLSILKGKQNTQQFITFINWSLNKILYQWKAPNGTSLISFISYYVYNCSLSDCCPWPTKRNCRVESEA